MLINNKLYCVALFVLGVFLGGCQPKVYLMPSPVGLEPGGEWFDLSEGTKDENLLYTLYATNRQPIETTNKSDHYTTVFFHQTRSKWVLWCIGLAMRT